MNCKNCNEIVDGNFCSNCGQSKKIAQINFSNFLKEFSTSVFQIDKGFFYSMKMLFRSPGQTIRGYLQGKRKNHFKPIAYVFTLSTIYFLVSQLLETETFFNDFISGLASSGDEFEENSKPVAILNWFAEHYSYTMLLLLPLTSLASYVAFSGSKYNYLEHFILNAYITGQQAILYTIAAILIAITGKEDIFVTIILLASIFYNCLVFWQFFSERSRTFVILRTILNYVFYFVIVLLITFLILGLSEL